MVDHQTTHGGDGVVHVARHWGAIEEGPNLEPEG